MTEMINRIEKGLKALLICAVIPIMLSACWEDLEEISDKMGGEIYAIGDIGPSGVGIVFYVTDGGLHGLEVAPVDQSTGAAWKTTSTDTLGTSTAIGTGYANTTAMAGAAHPAAELCRAYTGGGKTDWFLPSKDELNAIWVNLVDDGSGGNNGVGGFGSVAYWSSSEFDNYYAWNQRFDDGSLDYNDKTNAGIRVRAVRAF